MTPTQDSARRERVAIMVVEGANEAEAINYCDQHPDLYGIPIKNETQDNLF